MPDTNDTPTIEPRWPVALATSVVFLMMSLMPRPLKLWPGWFTWAIGLTLLLPMSVVAFGRRETRVRWLKIERTAIVLATIIGTAAVAIGLGHLIHVLLVRAAVVTGLELLTTSVGIWIGNILVFSIAFWLIDLGGPEARVARVQTQPDWLFPAESTPELAARGWRPSYVDYLFLAFSTATAFSATDAAPMTTRAKLLMMLEATISLATLVVVVSRAINILG